MKELQDFIPITKKKITIARIYYIEIVYVFEDNREESNIMTDISYSKKEKAEEIKNQFENSALPAGVIKVRCNIIPSVIEIDI